jgi:hypothetical protein
VTSCTERAGFLSSAIASSVVESGAFVTSGCNYIVFKFEEVPSEFYLLMQQQLSSLGTHFHYQVPTVFPCFITEFGFYVTLFQVDVRILHYQGVLYAPDGDSLRNIEDY